MNIKSDCYNKAVNVCSEKNGANLDLPNIVFPCNCFKAHPKYS